MKPEVWERVKSLFEGALALKPETRPPFVEANCSDPEVRKEVFKLLANHSEMGSFLSTHDRNSLSRSSDSQLPSVFVAGQLLAGRFTVIRLIARGGMGEVYEALDAELETRVAIKTIRADLLTPDLLQRFRGEVQLAKRVTHPNICRVYDMFRHSSEACMPVFFISMELLRGETLAETLRRVPRLSTREALPLVLQIASALEAAHSVGVLHRDLKPQNVMLVPAERGIRAVVMDFGVALQAAGSAEHFESATLTGTPIYMSPEQLEGRALTSASDIYALGLVMYRMVTGSDAFEDAITTSMALKRLSESPKPPRDLISDLDRRWETAILRCLEREPSRRYPSARSVADALIDTKRISPATRVGLYVLFVLVLLTICGFGFIIWNSRHKPEARKVEYTQLTSDGRPKDGPLLTNGHLIFFMQESTPSKRIMRIPVSGGEAVPMDVYLPNARLLDISRDGSLLLLSSDERSQTSLWVYPATGGEPRLFATGQVEAGWAPDGKAIVTSNQNILSIADVRQTRTIQAAVLPGFIDMPKWSPDGKRIRFAVQDFRIASRSLWEADASGKGAHRLSLLSDGADFGKGSGVWNRDGKYFFYAAGTVPHRQLWAMSESRLRGWDDRRAVQLTDGAGSWSWPTISPSDSTLFALNEAPRSELVRLDVTSGFWNREWDGAPAYELDSSRDGKWVAYTRYPDHTIWKARTDGSERVQLTDRTLEAHEPRWSPDGRKIAIMAKKKTGEWRIFCVPSEGGQPEELLSNGEDQGVPTWSPDGRFLIFGDLQFRKPKDKMSIHLLDLRTRQLSEIPGSKGLWSPRWSPDGRYVIATATDLKALYITSPKNYRWRQLPIANSIDHATWSADSRYIYFDGRDEAGRCDLFRVSIRQGKLEHLADLRNFAFPHETWFGVAQDGTPLALQANSVKEIYALKYVLP